MKSESVRKYIDIYGNISIVRHDGHTLTLGPALGSPNDFEILERVSTCDLYCRYESTGLLVERGNHEYVGFYAYPDDVLSKLQYIDLADEYDRELRQLLPAVEAMAIHYTRHTTETESHRVNVRVYGLISTNLRQSQRGVVMVCPIEGTGRTRCGHRIQGYMYNFHDGTVKFDNIQAWRMRELTAEELMDFDPRWGNLVKSY